MHTTAIRVGLCLAALALGACSQEPYMLAAHLEASTLPDGRILEDAPLCRKHRPAAPKNAAPTATAEPPR